MLKFEVNFNYFSSYENDEDNYSTDVIETFEVESLDQLLGILGLIDDDDLFDMDFDDSEGINFDAESDMIESGRNVIWIKDEHGKIVWSDKTC